MSKRILRWFGDFRNEIVLGMVREHLEELMIAKPKGDRTSIALHRWLATKVKK